MNWHVSRALEADCLHPGCLAGERFAPLSATPTPLTSSLQGRRTARLSRSRSGTTSAHLTDVLSGAALTSYLEDFPVKPIPQRLRARTLLMISGRKCGGSWQMSLPGTSLPRTSSEERSIAQRTTLRRWVTKPAHFPFPRRTWVQITFGPGIGFLHTPTTQGNYCAPSMQKHACCRAWATVFGRVSPEAQEWLMGWPEGWTALQPLETDKFQLWLSLHYSPSLVLKDAA
jgi:hypothetical protein